MSIRNRIIEQICNRLRGLKSNEFDVRLRKEFGTQDENTRKLLQLVTEDFEAVQSRNDETNLFIGRFFGIILLIEAKLTSLLLKVDPEIESRTLGKKINTYCRLLNELEKPTYGFDLEEIKMYRNLIVPLREIAKIRNHMAHDLNYTTFTLKDVIQIERLVKRSNQNLYYGVTKVPRHSKPLVAVAAFGFIVSAKTSMLRQSLS